MTDPLCQTCGGCGVVARPGNPRQREAPDPRMYPCPTCVERDALAARVAGPCEACAGSGLIGTRRAPCPVCCKTCEGEGEVENVIGDGVTGMEPCPVCQ